MLESFFGQALTSQERVMLDFVCVGVQKCGTSWLDHILRNFSHTHLPKDTKETFFFDDNYHNGLKWYFSHFPKDSNCNQFGEIAPSYFISDVARERILRDFPECKIVIMLRSPLERTTSHLNHLARRGRLRLTALNTPSRAKAVEGLLSDPHHEIFRASAFHLTVPKWTESVPKRNLFFIDYAKIRIDKEAVLLALGEFLGIELSLHAVDFGIKSSETINERKWARWPWLSRAAFRTSKYFQAHGLERLVYVARNIGFRTILERPPKQSKRDQEILHALVRQAPWYDEAAKYYTKITGTEIS